MKKLLPVGKAAEMVKAAALIRAVTMEIGPPAAGGRHRESDSADLSRCVCE